MNRLIFGQFSKFECKSLVCKITIFYILFISLALLNNTIGDLNVHFEGIPLAKSLFHLSADSTYIKKSWPNEWDNSFNFSNKWLLLMDVRWTQSSMYHARYLLVPVTWHNYILLSTMYKIQINCKKKIRINQLIYHAYDQSIQSDTWRILLSAASFQI